MVMDTPAAQFLSELYYMEAAQNRSNIIFTSIAFKGRFVELQAASTYNSSLISLPVTTGRQSIYRAVKPFIESLCDPSAFAHEPMLDDTSVPSLWIDLHYDLTRDDPLSAVDAFYTSISLKGDTAIIRASRGSSTCVLDVPLRPGVFQTMISSDLRALL